ncbi:MAG: carboxymuconolactone decarboxylase family protein [Rhodospirillales bacterium]
MSDERYQRGRDKLHEFLPDGPDLLEEAPGQVAPDLIRHAYEFAYSDVYCRPGLDPNIRQVATIAALTALGNVPSQLGNHIKAGLNTGLSREEIIEVIMQMAVYAGFPAALNAAQIAKEVFQELDEI